MSTPEAPRANPDLDPDTGHEYDGIREFDNKLPNWWLATLYATMVFSVGYWFYYHLFDAAPNQMTEYRAELDQRAAEKAARAKAKGGVTDETLAALASVSANVAAGQATYTQFCLACHGDKGQGLVGPNLTDNVWIHGGKPTQILKTVTEGVVSKGMVAWGPTLGDTKVEQVVAYLLTIKNTNVAGKAPEGTPE